MTDEKTNPDTGVRKLYRSRTNRYIGGVCGGVAEYFNIEVLIVRLLFVILAIAGGAGLLAYLAFLIITPENPELTPPQARKSIAHTDRSILIGSVFILIGFVFLLENFDFWHFNWNILWPGIFSLHFFLPGLIIVVGILVILKGLQKPTEKSAGPEPSSESATSQQFTTAPQSSHAPHSSYAPHTYKRLERIPGNKMIAGVCAGIANYFDIDPVFVRIGWVVMTIAAIWFGVLIYLVLALFLPEAQYLPPHLHAEDNSTNNPNQTPETK